MKTCAWVAGSLLMLVAAGSGDFGVITFSNQAVMTGIQERAGRNLDSGNDWSHRAKGPAGVQARWCSEHA